MSRKRSAPSERRVTREELEARYRALAELDVAQALGALLEWGLEELRQSRDATTPPTDPAEGVEACKE